MIYCGIDPGQSGGIATIEDGMAAAWSMPDTERDTFDLLRREISNGGNVVVYMEAVHSFPGQGVSSSFTFGKNYGFLRGLLVAMRVPLFDVSPQKWQGSMGLQVKSRVKKHSKADGPLTPVEIAANKRIRVEEKAEHKRALKETAQNMFPGIVVTLAKCDALLIAEYGRRQK